MNQHPHLGIISLLHKSNTEKKCRYVNKRPKLYINFKTHKVNEYGILILLSEFQNSNKCPSESNICCSPSMYTYMYIATYICLCVRTYVHTYQNNLYENAYKQNRFGM